MARVLYHFTHSPFARRARMALAFKGLTADLRDARDDPSASAEAARKSPLATVPVLDDDGLVLGDSTAMVHYLDRVYPAPPLLPSGKEALAAALSVMAQVDLALGTLVDAGTRYWPLRGDAAWAGVVEARIGRAQAAIDAVAARAGRPFLAGDAFGAADIYALSATRWVAAFPARAAGSPNVAQILTLGFALPEALVAWAKQHEARPEVQAAYA